jgi:ATP-dependent Clp protease ATP-binding subunit ClpB
VLLQILDDGRLTDSQGRTVDFRNTVIIMTSNVGSQYILEQSGSTPWADIAATVEHELQRLFRPEFLNRVDDVIIFHPLGTEELRQIVDLQLKRLAGMAADLGVVLEVTEGAKEAIARSGYDPAYGARPLKRAIQRMVQDPLALRMLEEDVPEGTRVRVVEAGEGELAFELSSENEHVAVG